MKRLRQLIDERRRALDLTWEGLDARTVKLRQQRISAYMWEHWAAENDDHEPPWENLPKTKILQSMAATLGVTVAEVLGAAEVSLGMISTVEQLTPHARVMIATMGRRTSTEQDLLTTMLQQGIAMLDATAEADADVDDA